MSDDDRATRLEDVIRTRLSQEPGDWVVEVDQRFTTFTVTRRHDGPMSAAQAQREADWVGSLLQDLVPAGVATLMAEAPDSVVQVEDDAGVMAKCLLSRAGF